MRQKPSSGFFIIPFAFSAPYQKLKLKGKTEVERELHGTKFETQISNQDVIGAIDDLFKNEILIDN